jgi:hypothetical protein
MPFLINKLDSLDKDVVNFKKLIFENGKKITLKSYLIQNKGINNTKIEFLGKVAGIDKFIIQAREEAIETEEKKSKYSLADWWIMVIPLAAILFFMIINLYWENQDKKRFEIIWMEFESKYPEFQNQKEIIKEVKFNDRINMLILRLLRGDKEYLDRHLKRSRSLLLASIRNRYFVYFPKKFFHVENQIVSLNPKHEKIIKTFYEFNGYEL